MKKTVYRIIDVAVVNIVAGCCYSAGMHLFNYIQTKIKDKNNSKHKIGFNVGP